jgi:hypothetical protein
VTPLLSAAAALILLATPPPLVARAERAARAAAISAEDEAPCPEQGEVIAVDTGRHALWLCSDGVPEARFTIALGRGGVGKRQSGDERTPLGSYPVGEPRPSNLYGTFIPIGYPTAAQAARGYSGGSVGIHGPPRNVTYRATGLDWTLGCVATGTDPEVDAIAGWVRARRPTVVIHGPAPRQPLASRAEPATAGAAAGARSLR